MAPDQIGFSVGREMFSDEFEEEGAEVLEPANTMVTTVGGGVTRPAFVWFLNIIFLKINLKENHIIRIYFSI